jgi:protein-tyrosine phosphatase
MGRDLSWDACWNVRDLGGFETRTGGQTRSGRIVRAGNLSQLTDAGRDALIEFGIRTVIDLRDPREFAVDMDPFHDDGRWAGQVDYVSAPLISEAEWEAIRDPEILRRGYVVTLDLSRANIARVLSAIANAAAGGIVVHCHAGKERTGVVAALLLALCAVPDDMIAADYVASDRHLTSLYAAWASREADPEKRAGLMRGFVSEPKHILVPLEGLRRTGGVETYARRAGVSHSELHAIRERLCG